MSVREGSALVLTARAWGESGCVASLLCPQEGLLRGLIKRPAAATLQPFNSVGYRHTRRLDTQLGSLQLELQCSRAALWMGRPLRALSFAALADVLAALLPEEHPYPALCAALPGLLSGPLAWRSYTEFERLLLEETGYGLRLEDPVPCALNSPLTHVSPNTWRSVPAAVAQGYEHRLLTLPACWGGPAQTEAEEFTAAWALTGSVLAHALQGPFMAEKLAARERLGQAFMATFAAPAIAA